MIKIYNEKVNKALKEYLPERTELNKNLIDSMEYSLMAGGKRIRPILMFEFCRVCGGDINKVIPFACALEMIHTYSLIHDDLPCMDDDDLRRGKPSNHVKFGEAMALLAGDGLLNLAFETMLSKETVELVGLETTVKAAQVLSQASGSKGMVEGQVIDMESEGKKISPEVLTAMNAGKTGAIISAAAKMGCIIAKAGEEEISAANTYAKNIGLAFQIVDDILDCTSSSEILGKKVGSDKDSDKSTYVTLFGIEKSRDMAKELTEKAIKSLDAIHGDTEFLKNLAMKLLNREK